MKNLIKTGGIFGLILAGISSAFAAVPADVSTALTDLKGDVTTIAGLAFAAFLVIVLFNYMRKATH